MTGDVFQPLPAINGDLTRVVGSLRLPRNLVEAIEYALLGGGKRLRPLLAWHASVATGAPGEAALPACVAVELVHAFSLVHDDLPALDNDDLRRGLPTLHVHAGEAMAILAGDAMLALAFQSLVESGLPMGLGETLLRDLARGTMGMISGQVHDTLGGADPALAPADQVRMIHSNKTGALIGASVRMGALCGLSAQGPIGPEGKSRMVALTRYADAVGLTFQIADDLLDVEQTAEQAGKRTGKDRGAGKLTYPGVLGIEGSRREIERLHLAALTALTGLGAQADGLRRLSDVMAHRTK